MVERVPGVSPEETMIEAKVSAVESFGLENIQEMVKASGPCVTVLLPSYRPGAQAKSMAAMLKTNLQQAARQLTLWKISESAITDLLDPLDNLTFIIPCALTEGNIVRNSIPLTWAGSNDGYCFGCFPSCDADGGV
jgi:hypothetical protein